MLPFAMTSFQVEYLHPTLGIAFISWNPTLLGDTHVQAVRLATDFIRQGMPRYGLQS